MNLTDPSIATVPVKVARATGPAAWDLTAPRWAPEVSQASANRYLPAALALTVSSAPSSSPSRESVPSAVSATYHLQPTCAPPLAPEIDAVSFSPTLAVPETLTVPSR